MTIATDQRAPRLVATLRRYFPQVNRVADGNKPIKITVQNRDLKKALKKKHDACVMARACERQIPNCDGALIQQSRAYIIKGNLAIRYSVPSSVMREVTSFDRHKDFRVGEYHLAPVNPNARLAADGRKRKGGGTGRTAKKRFVVHRTEGVRGMLAYDGV